MSEALYETDFYAWARGQAEALRARGGGGNALDYDNLAEEVDDLAARDRDACESQVENILAHLLKIEYLGGDAAGHWAGEIVGFRIALEKKLSPTLRVQLPGELERAYAYARRGLTGRLAKRGDHEAAARIPATNPYDWNDVTGRNEDWTPEPWPGETQDGARAGPLVELSPPEG